MSQDGNREDAGSQGEDKAGRIVAWLREKQAEDILGLDVREINSCTEAMIVVSARNVRHAQALADWVLSKLSQTGMELLGIEGYHPGYWILLDANEVVLHIFQVEYREFYNLDGLWRETPRLKEHRGQETEEKGQGAEDSEE